MWLAKYTVFIFFTQCYHFGELNLLRRNVSDLYSFVVQLRNNSDSTHGYVAMIQAIFCPEQPICTDEDVEDSNGILETLPAALTVDDETLRVEDIKDFVGICCLPCSCSEACQEDDNCCPTKYYSNYTQIHRTVKRECVTAYVGSYKRPEKTDGRLPHYFMTTKCFVDISNDSLVSKCETPDFNNPDETVPVTSGTSGRIYWNKQCAICNGDTEILERWNSKLSLGNDGIVYFNAEQTPGLISLLNSIEELHAVMARTDNIHYTPPVPMDHDRCFKRHTSLTCKEQKPENKTEISFLQQACEQLYNPVFYSGTVKWVYLNIFCFLCFEQDKLEVLQSDKCSLKDHDVEKILSRQMTAILDYRATTKTRLVDKHRHHYFKENQKSCPCDQFYDYYQMMCRPLLCPVGEISRECHCIQPIKKLSGMPVYLKLKIMPKEDNLTSSVDLQVRKFHTALKKVLQKTISNITVEIVLTFREEKGIISSYFCIAVVRTNRGYDTKETLKRFLPYLDTSRSLAFSSMNIQFSVYFLTRVFIWVDKEPDNYRAGAEYLDEVEQKHNLTLIASNKEFVESRQEYIQFLSPLMYCEQVQLAGDEFIREHDKIIINTTSQMKYVRDFYLIPPSSVRICVDQYLAQPEISVKPSEFVPETLLVSGLLSQYFFV